MVVVRVPADPAPLSHACRITALMSQCQQINSPRRPATPPPQTRQRQTQHGQHRGRWRLDHRMRHAASECISVLTQLPARGRGKSPALSILRVPVPVRLPWLISLLPGISTLPILEHCAVADNGSRKGGRSPDHRCRPGRVSNPRSIPSFQVVFRVLTLRPKVGAGQLVSEFGHQCPPRRQEAGAHASWSG